jgi:hypothetical protein
MRRTLTALSLTAVLIAAAAGCAAEPGGHGDTVDLDAAREWAAGVQSEQSDGPGLAGSGTLTAEPADPDAEPDDGEEPSGVRLDFDAAKTVVRADVRCYGGHTAQVAVTVFTGDGASSDSFGDTIDCDEKSHDLALGTGGTSDVTSALIEAEADPATVVFVAVIEGLTVERE